MTTTRPPFDSLAVLRDLMAQFPEIPVEWAETAVKDEEAHYCERCQVDFSPEVCAAVENPDVCQACDDADTDCRECGTYLIGDAEHERRTCDVCHAEALRDANDERKYREAL